MKIDYFAERFKLNFRQKYSDRQKKLAIFEKIYNGSIYDNLPPFYQEYGSNGVDSPGGYIPLAQRRPSVKYKISKIIVNEIASMLFGESHFPQVRCADKDHQDTSEFLQKITSQSNLRLAMINAVKTGSVGSVAIVVKYLEGKFCFEVLKTKYLTPEFDQFDNTILIRLIEKKIFSGKKLISLGYSIKEEDEGKDFCLMREWIPNHEIYYFPYKVEDEEENISLIIDNDRSTPHNLGFVPVVWIKNPDEADASDVDGACIFSDIIDIGIEIDYQLSQHGRLLKYNSDPTLVIKDPSRLMDNELIKGTGALQLGEGGDAKYLQLESSATEAVLAYVKQLRQMAIEVVRGDRANPDKLLAGNSGKALQMLNKPMISLVDELRISYGEIGLLNIYKMIYCISTHKNIDTKGLNIQINDGCDSDLLLDWPQFYPVTEQDKSTTANTLKTLTDSGNLSHKTALTSIADDYNIQSVDDEIKEIEADQAALAAKSPKITEVINA